METKTVIYIVVISRQGDRKKNMYKYLLEVAFDLLEYHQNGCGIFFFFFLLLLSDVGREGEKAELEMLQRVFRYRQQMERNCEVRRLRTAAARPCL